MKPGQYWTATWSPVSGCTPVSEGCANCFAKDMARRFPESHAGYHEVCESCSPNDGGDCGDCEGRVVVPFSQVVCHPDRLDIPLHWRKPRRVLVCSMGDLFHPQVPEDFLRDVFTAIANAPKHTYLLLTKRARRMGEFFMRWDERHRLAEWPNVWLGISAEDQTRLKERWAILRTIPAARRFISLEPLLEGIGFQPAYEDPRIHGFIAGCESGPHRRLAPHDWFRVVRNFCEGHGKPFFLKQMSENEDGTGRVVKMPELDGRVWDQMPEAMVEVLESAERSA